MKKTEKYVRPDYVTSSEIKAFRKRYGIALIIDLQHTVDLAMTLRK